MANIVKAHILGAEESGVDAAGRSTQLPDDTWDYQKTGAKEPPYNLDALCLFLEINTWHYRSVKAKAISTAGLGFDFVTPEEVKEPKPENKQVLKEFFNHPNDEMTWGEILENVLTDFEALGNGYFEVVRNRFGGGRPRAIHHIPAVTMRVRKDKKGFLQQRDNRMVYFRNFGSDAKDADSYDPRDQDAPTEKHRLLNEVIHLKNYHPRSSYYGLPDFLPALRALVGNKKAGDFNITFFENNAVPQYAIIVKGGELARGTRKRIEEYFRTHIKGHAHKKLILEVVQEEGEKVDIEIRPPRGRCPGRLVPHVPGGQRGGDPRGPRRARAADRHRGDGQARRRVTASTHHGAVYATPVEPPVARPTARVGSSTPALGALLGSPTVISPALIV